LTFLVKAQAFEALGNAFPIQKDFQLQPDFFKLLFQPLSSHPWNVKISILKCCEVVFKKLKTTENFVPLIDFKVPLMSILIETLTDAKYSVVRSQSVDAILPFAALIGDSKFLTDDENKHFIETLESASNLDSTLQDRITKIKYCLDQTSPLKKIKTN